MRAPTREGPISVLQILAADRVDSTTGVQMAFLKQWAARSHNQLELRLPDLLPRAAHGKGNAHSYCIPQGWTILQRSWVVYTLALQPSLPTRRALTAPRRAFNPSWMIHMPPLR